MRRLCPAVAAVACVAFLSACGGTPDASPAPTATTSAAAPSPPPEPTSAPPAPTTPSEITQRNRRGAVAATRFFLETMNFAGTTGDTEPFRATYTDFCTRCEAIADGIDQTYADGGRISGGAWTPRKLEYYAIVDGVAFVDALVDTSSQEFVESAGATPRSFAPEERRLRAFQLEWRQELGWAVGALDPET